MGNYFLDTVSELLQQKNTTEKMLFVLHFRVFVTKNISQEFISFLGAILGLVPPLF